MNLITFNEYVDNVYLINLDRRPDRLEKAAKELALENIHFQRWKAIDGKNIDSKFQESAVNSSSKALTLTNREIIVDAIQKGYRRIAICEDDIKFVPDFKTKFSDFVKRVDMFDDGWSMLWPGFTYAGDYQTPDHVTENVDRVTGYYGTQCVIIPAHMFSSLIALIDAYVEEKPIDVIWRFFVQSQGRCYAPPKPIIEQFGFDSDIYVSSSNSYLPTCISSNNRFFRSIAFVSSFVTFMFVLIFAQRLIRRGKNNRNY